MAKLKDYVAQSAVCWGKRKGCVLAGVLTLYTSSC